jgi:hypothetical protein
MVRVSSEKAQYMTDRHMWVAANILNKQSRTADRGLSPRFGLGAGLNKPSQKTAS